MESDNWEQLKNLFHALLNSPEASERAKILENCDEDLRREVEKLWKAHGEAGDFIIEPAFVEAGYGEADKADFYVGKQIGSYKILHEIGHGGMGTVYLAARADDFEKRVAVKLINRGMDTNAVLRRFVKERQILAGLENANIAGLLDGGSTADGLPYLVMEYIEGEPITKFCDLRDYGLEERLELFRKVCAAISYAHQNLIVHRDIKPSNILVSEDGIPKLLDFGIAKLLNPERSSNTSEATATMFHAMTPEYAAPEQLRGLAVTTASDVYSLGVVLYELLSGRRPYKIESLLPGEIAQIVLTEEPIRPSSVQSSRFKVQSSKSETENSSFDTRQTANDDPQTNPKSKIQNLKSLKGDLDNIILKAIRKEPERRYQSVQEFSEDIRRHLAGLPVTATADTPVYRFNKFVTRHRAGVLAGGLIILTLLAATAVTGWQAVVAGRERDKAEMRFKQVRKLANTVLFEYHDGIEKLAGSTPMREKMVKDALEYLDNLAGESSPDDADLQRELAAAYQKIGDVQGNPFLANLGNQDGALESYRKAFAIHQGLLAVDANNPATRFSAAQSYEKIGDILWAKGESAESEASYRKALAICEELRAAGALPDAFSFARLYTRIGQPQEQAGDFKAALETYQKSLQASEDLVLIEPSNVKYRRAVSVSHAKIGDIFFQLDDYPAASENYQKSLPILQDLSAADPTDTILRRSLGLVLARVALAKMEAGEFSQAVEYNEQTIRIQRDIFAADPNNRQIQFDLADTLTNLGETYGRMKKTAAADKNFGEAISIFKVTFARNPNYAQARSHFANTQLMYADTLLKNGNAAGALENYRQALTTLEAETAETAGRDSSEKLAKIYEGIADAQISLNKKSENLGEIKMMYQKSLDVWQKLRQNGSLQSKDANKFDRIKQKLEKCDPVPVKH